MSTTDRYAHLPTFPIPVVSLLGPGSQEEDEELDYIVMPQGMSTYRAPQLPEPEALVGHEAALDALTVALAQLKAAAVGEAVDPIELHTLSLADRKLINLALGEGEVSARVLPQDGETGLQSHIQESVYAGLWRVVTWKGQQVVHDRIEVGPVPQTLVQALQQDFAQLQRLNGLLDLPPPEGVLNATPLLVEIQAQVRERLAAREQGQVLPSHTLNLTLLPMTPLDIGFLDHMLGTGRVMILSRGYGNCRITNALTPDTWRVVYYNSAESVILNSVELTPLPEVVLAAPEDLHDSAERLEEVLTWMKSAQ